MTFGRCLIFLAWVLQLLCCNAAFAWTDIPFDNHQVLDPLSKYHLYWNANEDGITMEVSVETLGWVGLGFSPNGGMEGADMVMAWIMVGFGLLVLSNL